MGTFFVEWELWEELTFVLACCIVLVVILGLIKLWWTNRTTRRLEAVDEEKRVRLSQMRQCGVNATGGNDIPFGIRAILSGVEVDGIWISRPNTPDTSQMASSTTLVGEHRRASRGRSKQTGSSSESRQPSSVDDIISPCGPSSANSNSVKRSNSRGVEHRVPLRNTVKSSSACKEEASRPERYSLEAYTLSGASRRHRRHRSANTVGEKRHGPMAYNHGRHSSDVASPGAGSLATRQAPCGAAEVYANRTSRRTNGNFEVLPAGALGPRQELLDSTSQHQQLDSLDQNQSKGHGKLRKKQPPENARNAR